jgi:hypothetical protein
VARTFCPAFTLLIASFLPLASSTLVLPVNEFTAYDRARSWPPALASCAADPAPDYWRPYPGASELPGTRWVEYGVLGQLGLTTPTPA